MVGFVKGIDLVLYLIYANLFKKNSHKNYCYN